MSEVVISCHSIDEWKLQLEEATKSNKPIVIDFTASWCPPCRMIAPIFVDFAKKYPNVIFVKIDVDELKAVAAEFKVEAMPTFVFLKDGKEIENSRVIGASKEKLEAQVKLVAEQKI